MTIVLKIANEHGDLVQNLPQIIFYPKHETLPTPPEARAGSISLQITVLIISVLAILVILLCIVGFVGRKRLRRNNENRNLRNGDNSKVDLDNIPETEIQHLEHKLLPNDHNHLIFHRSESEETKKIDNQIQIDTANGFLPQNKNLKSTSVVKTN